MEINVDNDREYLPPTTPRFWNSSSETLLCEWAEDYEKECKRHRRFETFFAVTNVSLLMSSMILSYVFGSSGLAVGGGGGDTIARAQSYVLIAVGVISTVLKLGDFEKRAAWRRRRSVTTGEFARKIRVQLALPRDRRKPFLPFIEKMERKRRELYLSANDRE